MEKSKTTPDVYPMSYAGLTTGCNQKSNRAPITNYTSEQIETIVDELRALGAAAMIQGSGRVTKVRHYAYHWLGLEKVEAAIMTELLLRGEQTLGELRTRDEGKSSLTTFTPNGNSQRSSRASQQVFPVDSPAAMRRKIPMTPKRHTLGSIPEPTHREVRNWPPRSKP